MLLNNPESAHFFNENDIDIIVGVALRELGSPNTARSRVQILKVLNQVLTHKQYMKYFPHRLDDMNEVIEQQIMFEDEEQVYSVKERSQFARINIRLEELTLAQNK